MRKRFVLGSIVALGLCGPAIAADGFSYSFVDAEFVKSEIDDIDVEGDGFGIVGSYEFTENLHGFVEYADQDFDFDVSAQTLQVGAGVNWPLNPNLDVIGTLSYVQAEVDVPTFGSVDDDGFGLGVGLRGRVLERLELTGGIDYVDLKDSGDDTAFGVGARYFFTDMFAVGADANFNDDGTTWMLGARLNFGK
jgi:hypothetical protein